MKKKETIFHFFVISQIAKINSNALDMTVFFLQSHLFEPEKLSMLSSQKEIRILLSGQTVIVAKVK